MPEKLFNEYAAENALGRQIIDITDEFLFKLLVQYPHVDLNDLELVVAHTVAAVFAESRLSYAATMRRQENMEKYLK